MSKYIGIDTSNYTTSVSLYDTLSGSCVNKRKLLKVRDGEIGVRQNEAVFLHINQINVLIDEVIKSLDSPPSAIGVSKSPRDEEGSYMPCFTVGVSVASILSSVYKIPYYTFSHQSGHIASALYSKNRLDLLKDKRQFIAFHVSGGTTEALIVDHDKDNIIKSSIAAKSLDLKAGQLIDRVGNMLGLKFPSGPDLEKLALEYKDEVKVKPFLNGCDCSLSGVENLCKKMLDNNEKKPKIARFCIEYILKSLDLMCKKLMLNYHGVPILFAGGVMSNSIIRNSLENKYNAVFSKPEFSSDNAVGLAVLASLKESLK